MWERGVYENIDGTLSMGSRSYRLFHEFEPGKASNYPVGYKPNRQTQWLNLAEKFQISIQMIAPD